MSDTHPGELLGEWLAETGRKPSWLADEAGISRPHMSLILSKKKGLSVASAERMAEITKIDARRLIGLSMKEVAA